MSNLCNSPPLNSGEELLDVVSETESNSGTLKKRAMPGSSHMEVDPPAKASAGPPPKGQGSENNSAESIPKGLTSDAVHSNSGAYQAGSDSAEKADPDPAALAKLEKGFNKNLYVAIKKLRNAAMNPRHLGWSGEAAVLEPLVANNSINKGACFYRHIYDAKLNISFSFEPRSLTCQACESNPHHILGDVYQLACFILSDQCFPAVLPAKSGHLCPAIIRVEDGTLADVWACFLKNPGQN